MALRGGAAEPPAAIVLVLELDDDPGIRGPGPGVEFIGICDYQVEALGAATRLSGLTHQAAVLGFVWRTGTRGAEHQHGRAPHELSMGDATLFIRNHQMPDKAEVTTQPVDGRGRVPVTQTGDQARMSGTGESGHDRLLVGFQGSGRFSLVEFRAGRPSCERTPEDPDPGYFCNSREISAPASD